MATKGKTPAKAKSHKADKKSTTARKDSDEVLDQLVDFYTLQEQLYRLLLQLTEVQLEALKSRATSKEFIRLVEKKEGILRSIERVERWISPVKSDWMENNGECPGDREKLGKILDAILELMDEIANNEQRSQRLLEKWDSELSPGTSRAKRAAHPMGSFSNSAKRIRASIETSAF